MKKRYLFHILAFPIFLTLLLISSVPTSFAFSGGSNLNQTLPEKMNLLTLIRASQSSSTPIRDLNYSKTPLEIIQESLQSVLAQSPLPPNVNLGVMAYGHLIDRNSFETSCSQKNIELLFPFQPSTTIGDLPDLAITGTGESPTGLALEMAGAEFTDTTPGTKNVILLIANGADLCHQNPVETAEKLAVEKSIAVYTIGLLTDDSASAELDEIAKRSSGRFERIGQYIDDNEVAIAELTKALSSVFDNLLSQIATPSPTSLPTLTEAAPFTPTFTETPIITSPSTEIPTQPVLETRSPVPLPTGETPSSTIGSSGILIILGILLSGLGVGYWFWKLRTPQKPVEKPAEPEHVITDDEKLERFRRDLFSVYASIHAKKYTRKYSPLKSIKQKLSSKYTPEQFNELLAQARRKYPNNIWIDKDKNGEKMVKIVDAQ